jgi:hypothetical protein
MKQPKPPRQNKPHLAKKPNLQKEPPLAKRPPPQNEPHLAKEPHLLKRPHRQKKIEQTLLTAAVLLACAISPPQAHPQGCTQCRDNTASTPPATQAAYRHAIILMVCTAGGLFLTTLILLKRHR